MNMNKYLKNFLTINKDLIQEENFSLLFDNYNKYFKGHPNYLINDEGDLTKQELLNCLLEIRPLDYILSKMDYIPDFTFTYYQGDTIQISNNVNRIDREAFYGWPGRSVSLPNKFSESDIERFIGFDNSRITIRN